MGAGVLVTSAGISQQGLGLWLQCSAPVPFGLSPSQLLVPVPVPPPAAAGDARPTRPRRGSAPLCCLPCQSRRFPKPREFCGSWRSFCSVLAPSWTWAPSHPARRALGRTRAVRSRGGGGGAAGHPGFPPRQRPEGFGTGRGLEGAGRAQACAHLLRVPGHRGRPAQGVAAPGGPSPTSGRVRGPPGRRLHSPSAVWILVSSLRSEGACSVARPELRASRSLQVAPNKALPWQRGSGGFLLTGTEKESAAGRSVGSGCSDTEPFLGLPLRVSSQPPSPPGSGDAAAPLRCWGRPGGLSPGSWLLAGSLPLRPGAGGAPPEGLPSAGRRGASVLGALLGAGL